MSYLFDRRNLIFFVSVFLLLTTLGAAFSPVTFAAQPPPETVYCPLTHQFQPIKTQRFFVAAPLDEICANDNLKNKFLAQLLGELTLKPLELNSTEFSALAFDFWRAGKSAFASAPHKPDSNEQLAAKNSFAAIISGSRDEDRIAFKISQKFVFQTKPRPPTIEFSAAFDFQHSSNLETISRRIAPRAPPIFS